MKFKFFDEINSTNTYLRRQLRIEEFEVIVAKKQTDGKKEKGTAHGFQAKVPPSFPSVSMTIMNWMKKLQFLQDILSIKY